MTAFSVHNDKGNLPQGKINQCHKLHLRIAQILLDGMKPGKVARLLSAIQNGGAQIGFCVDQMHLRS